MYLRMIAPVNIDNHSKFSYKLGNLKTREYLSMIAIYPQYGISEPAVNVIVRSIDGVSK
ncbi:hypothetical protein FJSC11DRAFT_2314 [Fischerella thermalis JSC-11]|uniref:Uncharacterized protein n=1 Tax=Fischerella thermalis JSC-11 TaxID=741277 RepID=G6FTW7_9CYAN|nr:hypothetical protein FJSC11DRAFT_2314 [Fischerella thermalis JSC-11]